MDQTQSGYRSVLSQLASAVSGNGALYYVAMGSLLCVLALSANTSFVDFPRLCRMVATDGFLPKPFAVAGHRLVFSVGIVYLAIVAGILLILFDGITDRLIPLFAIGAFLTFTLSQSGMVLHWRRALRSVGSSRERHAIRLHFSINLTGATMTLIAFIVMVAAKFDEGAWITVLVIPAVIALLKTIRSYYSRLAARVRERSPLNLAGAAQPIIVIAIEDWNRMTDKAITLALTISRDVIGIHLAQLTGPESDEHQRRLKAQWQRNVVEPARDAGFPPPELLILQAHYRAIHEPILRLATDLETRLPGRPIAVLIPELVKQRWYQHLLHVHHARHLRSALLKCADPRITLISVPWYLEQSDRRAS